MVLVLELVDSHTLYQVWSGWFWYWNWWILILSIRSGLDGSGTGIGGFSYSLSGLVWMVLVLELVDPPTLERTKAIQVFPTPARYSSLHFRRFVAYVEIKNHEPFYTVFFIYLFFRISTNLFARLLITAIQQR
jgi:hypothetical protein